MTFSKNYDDYLVSKLIANHKSLSVDDIVAVTYPGWKSLADSKRFWTTVAVGSALGIVTFGAATGFVGLGSGAFGGLAIGAESIALAGAATGAAAGGAVGKAYNAYDASSVPEESQLKSMSMVGKILEIDKKNFSEQHHIQVEFFIPNKGGGYTEKTVWIDAHHLMKLITKKESLAIAEKIKARQEKEKQEYDKVLLKKHRQQFSPENVQLIKSLQSIESINKKLASEAQFLWAAVSVLGLITICLGVVIGINTYSEMPDGKSSRINSSPLKLNWPTTLG